MPREPGNCEEQDQPLFRALVERMNEGLAIDDRDGRLTYVNGRLCELLDRSAEELLGRPFRDLLDERNRDILDAEHASRTSEDTVYRSYEVTALRPDGSTVDLLVSPQALTASDGSLTGTFAVMTDLTPLRRTETERDLLATAIEQAAETVVITDVEGTIMYVNPAFEELTGYSRAEAIGRNPRILKSGHHDDGFYRDLWETIASGEVWTGFLTNRNRDGDLFEEEATISPVHDADGRITAYVAVKRDVSEENRLVRKVARTEKLEALGHLAGGIAHNLNNLLMAISGAAELLRHRVPGESGVEHELLTIEKTVERAAGLSRRLLSVARQQALELKVFDLGEMVLDELEIQRRVVPETIAIESDVDRDLPAVRADRDQVAQVLNSLILRARGCIVGRGVITVSVSSATPDALLLAAHPDVEGREFVRVSVADSGAGMNIETRDRVFDPFFGAASDDNGADLDLATVYGIVRQHGGIIDVESTPDGGSRFDVYLASTDQEPETGAPRSPARPVGGHETILVVEDEEEVRRAQVEMLEILGYTVIEAENGRVALDLFGARGEEIDLVLSDLVMPEIGGRELLQRVREVVPSMPFVFSSGYSNDHVLGELEGVDRIAFLSKPYSTAKLAETLRTTLAT